MAGIAGLGVLLLFTQFMTLGLLAVSATGGALLGYGIRARQYPALGQTPDSVVGSLPGKPAVQGRLADRREGRFGTQTRVSDTIRADTLSICP